MIMKKILTGKRPLVRVAATLTLLTGSAMAANIAVPHTHAGSGLIRTRNCLSCFLPMISVTNLVNATGGANMTGASEVDPASADLNVAGSNFPPGDQVHVELVSQDPSSAGSVMAAGDTAASLALTIPLGNGRYGQIPGGTFTIDLSADPRSPVTCNWQQMTAAVVATDQRTGAKVATGLLAISGWWLNNAVFAQSCPTATPLPPSGTPTPASGM